MSIAGGLHLALEEAARHRSGSVQLFTKGSNQWAAKPLDDESIALFKETNQRLGPFEMAAHSSYLINLGSPDDALWEKSLGALIIELERCEALGVPRLVFHPGAHMGAGEGAGLERVVRALRAACDATPGFRTRLLIENTAGQGSCLGHRLEHIEHLLAETADTQRVGVCLDTCHLLAAGYEYRTEAAFTSVRAEMQRRFGLHAVEWFHLNDSKKDLGSKVDRHENIGAGFVGKAAFSYWLQDPAFGKVPMVLETPKENEGDRKNLALLRRLVKKPVGRS